MSAVQSPMPRRLMSSARATSSSKEARPDLDQAPPAMDREGLPYPVPGGGSRWTRRGDRPAVQGLTPSASPTSRRAEIVVPEHARRDGSPRPPWPGQALDPRRIRQRAQALHLAKRANECEIAAGPHIRAAERHQEIDVRAPRADSF